jgi:hypothetical protein
MSYTSPALPLNVSWEATSSYASPTPPLDVTWQSTFFFVSIAVSDQTTNAYTVSGVLSEPGEVYVVAVLSTDPAPTTEQQIVLGKNGSNEDARGVGSATTNPEGEFSFSVTGPNLSDNLTNSLYYVGRTLGT